MLRRGSSVAATTMKRGLSSPSSVPNTGRRAGTAASAMKKRKVMRDGPSGKSIALDFSSAWQQTTGGMSYR